MAGRVSRSRYSLVHRRWGGRSVFTAHRSVQRHHRTIYPAVWRGVVTPKPRSLDRHTPEAIEDALIDLWLLRSTDFFVGTVGSSFSEMAMFGRAVPAIIPPRPPWVTQNKFAGSK